LSLSPYIFTGLRKNLDSYELLAKAIPADRLDQATGPNRFTAREALAHWADWESVHLSRLEAALAFDLVPVPNLNESEVANQKGYSSWTIEQCLDLMQVGRNNLIQFLEERSEFELFRRFLHPTFGTLDMFDYAGHVLGHDAYHIEQLLAFLLRR
jgi:hypothetical protein